jgi:hypothetical protein
MFQEQLLWSLGQLCGVVLTRAVVDKNLAWLLVVLHLVRLLV